MASSSNITLHTAPLYRIGRKRQPLAVAVSTVFSLCLKTAVSLMHWICDGRLLQASWPANQKPRLPNPVLVRRLGNNKTTVHQTQPLLWCCPLVCQFEYALHCCPLSMLSSCWLGGRKGIRPVKNCAVGCWRGCLSGARCRLAYGPANATHCLLLQ